MNYFRKSTIQKGKLHLIKEDSIASDLDRYTFSNAMAHSVNLGTWEALLEEYIDSVELVTQVSLLLEIGCKCIYLLVVKHVSQCK